MFEPNFRINAKTAKALMSIEADRQIVALLSITYGPGTVTVLDSLRRTARLLSTHLSTQIEGNRLSPSQVQAVVEGEGNFPGRERDESEVRYYFAALEYVEKLGAKRSRLTETEVRTIHGLVMTGEAKPTKYRDGQNVIRDSRLGRIVYLPPESKVVPRLMTELVRWVNDSLSAKELPGPIVTALAHYQFATIHPYFDGNGRTARLLSNLILNREGYGLNGIYSLEEYYASNLKKYYAGLATGMSHNYYFGRIEADVTEFVTYFCLGMADAFAKVRARVEGERKTVSVDQAPILRKLGPMLRKIGPMQRRALGLFLRMSPVTKNEIGKFFKLSPRRAYLLCVRWIRDGFLVIANPSTKGRSYQLAEEYQFLIN